MLPWKVHGVVHKGRGTENVTNIDGATKNLRLSTMKYLTTGWAKKSDTSLYIKLHCMRGITFLTHPVYPRNGTRHEHSYRRLIGSRMWYVEWYHFQWPWLTSHYTKPPHFLQFASPFCTTERANSYTSNLVHRFITPSPSLRMTHPEGRGHSHVTHFTAQRYAISRYMLWLCVCPSVCSSVTNHNHCKSLTASFNECRLSAGWPPQPQTKPINIWTVNPPEKVTTIRIYHRHLLLLILKSQMGWKAEST